MGWLPRQLLQRLLRRSIGQRIPPPEPLASPRDPAAGSGPESQDSREAAKPRPRRATTQPLLITTTVVAGGALTLAGLGLVTDRLLRVTYNTWRPHLEAQVGRIVGHPLRFGPYEGIGPDGIRIGTSRVLPGFAEGSTAAVQGVEVSLDPLASLRRGALVLELRFTGTQVDLRPNARGQLWVLGTLPSGGEPPRLAYRFRVRDALRLRLHHADAGATPLQLLLAGQVDLAPREHSLEGQLRAWPEGGSGEIVLSGRGQWRTHRWQLDLFPQQLALSDLRRLLPSGLLLEGKADGRLRLTLQQGLLGCQGEVALRQVRLRRSGWAQALESGELPLRCQATSLVLRQAPWRFGGWHGEISGSLTADRQLRARARVLPPLGGRILARPIEARLQGRWSRGSLHTEQLELASGASRLDARGELGTRLALAGSWHLQPQQLFSAGNPAHWLGTGAISGGFQLRGPLAAPELSLRGARQSFHPLLGPWQANVNWRAGVLRLERFEAGPLQARATLPLAVGRQGLTLGPVAAWIDLRDLPLSSLDPLVGTSLHGRLDARGWLRGPLKAPVPDLELTLRDPGAGPLQLREHWRGQLRGEAQGGARLQLDAGADALPGQLAAWLTPHWRPTRLRLERDGGLLELAGEPRQFRWTARDLPLHGLELLVAGAHFPQPMEGRLGGMGELGLQPFGFSGRVNLKEPGLFGLGGRLLTADFHYRDRRYRLKGSLQPLSPGTIDGELEGRWQGPFQARLQARGLSSLLAQQLADAWELWQGRRRPGSTPGSGADLGSQAITTLGMALEQQIQVLDQVRERLGAWEIQQRQRDRAARLAGLQMRLDADLTLAGPSLRQVRADLDARGHLWLNAKDRDLALARDPFQVRLQGPLSGGEGRFSLTGLTLALLSLLTPVPESLRGYLNATGSYRLGRGRPQLALELSLDQAQLGERALSLERGGLSLGPRGLNLDLVLKPQGSSGSIDLTGLLPLDPGSEELRLRLASRGDGLVFLSDLAGPGLRWRGGKVDLQLLMRGSLRDPIANGFLRIRDGSTDLVGLTLRQVQATVLFDFQQLQLQELHGRVGQRGEISGDGTLGLVRELGAQPTLTLKLSQVPFRQERINAMADGNLELGGSLLAPQLGGAVRISQGTINVTPAGIAPLEKDRGAPGGRASGSGHGASGEVHSANDLLQRRWTFREPLQLLGPTLDSGTARSLEAAIPRLPWLQFTNLRLVFGPNLRMVLPAIANFTTGGALRLNGHLDPTLQASGVVRLLKGRLNLFTTTFSLDPDTPNVAVFTPSQGLVPYLDIALRSRVADNRNQPLSPSLSPGESTALPILSEKDSQAGFSNFNQLNLILVTVSVSGPADELAQNIRLRSSPPLSQERLLALIGGNSLAGLQGGEAGTALATALGQSLLSPLLGSLTDALGQRVSLALYPTYVNQAISDGAAPSGERIAPQLVLAAEVGYDLTNRLNASLLAAPNRSDVPPQLNLNYKASNNLSLEGSVDTEGTWQTQLQLFLRF